MAKAKVIISSHKCSGTRLSIITKGAKHSIRAIPDTIRAKVKRLFEFFNPQK
jgi:hypothetical protein